MGEIKNIIFDLGMVILNIDFNAVEREFRKFNISNFENLYSRAKQINLFDRFEEGKILPEDFRNELRKYIDSDLSNTQIDEAWNSMLLDFPEKRIKFLEKIKLNYRTFLLSNTNKIHFDAYDLTFTEKYGYRFSDLFEGMYLSFEVGYRKPNFEIFNLLLKENNLNPEETLFVDDTSEHIQAAKSLGIRTHILLPDEEIYEVLSLYIK